MAKCGNADDHCCWFGQVCPHLEENTVSGRRWACGLHRKYGSWEAMYESEEWPLVLELAMSFGADDWYRCGNWPYEGEVCAACGDVGTCVKGPIKKDNGDIDNG